MAQNVNKIENIKSNVKNKIWLKRLTDRFLDNFLEDDFIWLGYVLKLFS